MTRRDGTTYEENYLNYLWVPGRSTLITHNDGTARAFEFTVEHAGTYIFGIGEDQRFGGEDRRYTVDVYDGLCDRLGRGRPGSSSSSKEANNIVGSGNLANHPADDNVGRLYLGQPGSGILNGGDVDCFRVELTAGRTYRFDMWGAGAPGLRHPDAGGTLAEPEIALSQASDPGNGPTSNACGKGGNHRLTYTVPDDKEGYWRLGAPGVFQTATPASTPARCSTTTSRTNSNGHEQDRRGAPPPPAWLTPQMEKRSRSREGKGPPRPTAWLQRGHTGTIMSGDAGPQPTETKKKVTTLNSPEDFLKALDSDPQLKKAVRDRILTEELMQLPLRFDTFGKRFDAFEKRTNETLDRHSGYFRYLRGADYEGAARRGAGRRLARLLSAEILGQIGTQPRDGKTELGQLLSTAPVPDLGDPERNAAADRDYDDSLNIDLMYRLRLPSGEEALAAGEASVTAETHDVTRARRRAQTIQDLTGIRTLPFLIGATITHEASAHVNLEGNTEVLYLQMDEPPEQG